MLRNRQLAGIALAVATSWVSAPYAVADSQAQPPQNDASPSAPGKLTVTVGKSLIIDSSLNIQRVSVANGDLVEAVQSIPEKCSSMGNRLAKPR